MSGCSPAKTSGSVPATARMITYSSPMIIGSDQWLLRSGYRLPTSSSRSCNSSPSVRAWRAARSSGVSRRSPRSEGSVRCFPVVSPTEPILLARRRTRAGWYGDSPPRHLTVAECDAEARVGLALGFGPGDLEPAHLAGGGHVGTAVGLAVRAHDSGPGAVPARCARTGPSRSTPWMPRDASQPAAACAAKPGRSARRSIENGSVRK